MIKFMLATLAITISMNAFAENTEEITTKEGFKRVEIGFGYIYGESSVGAKVKYQLADYLLGFEVHKLDVGNSNFPSFGGDRAREGADEGGAHLGATLSIGKDWSHSWFNTAMDIGIGYSPEGIFRNCQTVSSPGGGFFSSSFDECDLNVIHQVTIPMSVSFTLGKGVGIGLRLSAALSKLEDKVGFEVVIPFGTYE